MGFFRSDFKPTSLLASSQNFDYPESMAEVLSMPQVQDQQAFNLQRWEEVCADPFLSGIEGRIETDRFGQIIMNPPPGYSHGDFQSQITTFLRNTYLAGKSTTECPISTGEGVKAPDVAWISKERLVGALQNNVLTIAPEVCVEILSPSKSKSEIDEKKRLYFEAGAEEVWICDLNGHMFFFVKNSAEALETSKICPDFPTKVT
jgi:Uma2 family endonuclease